MLLKVFLRVTFGCGICKIQSDDHLSGHAKTSISIMCSCPIILLWWQQGDWVHLFLRFRFNCSISVLSSISVSIAPSIPVHFCLFVVEVFIGYFLSAAIAILLFQLSQYFPQVLLHLVSLCLFSFSPVPMEQQQQRNERRRKRLQDLQSPSSTWPHKIFGRTVIIPQSNTMPKIPRQDRH